MAKRRFRFGREYYIRIVDLVVARRYFDSARFVEVDIDDL